MIFLIINGVCFIPLHIFSVFGRAYNKAIVINCHQDGKDSPKETYLTGFFFGYVVGTNLGIYWLPLSKIPCLKVISSPIFDGLIIGAVVACIGHFIERRYKKRNKRSFNKDKE